MLLNVVVARRALGVQELGQRQNFGTLGCDN